MNADRPTNTLISPRKFLLFLFSFLISIISACAQQPSPTGSPTETISLPAEGATTVSPTSFEISTDSASNKIMVSMVGDQIIFEISSIPGIGNAKLQLGQNKSWPEVNLHFNLRGLEKLSLSYEDTDLTASISSSPPNQVLQFQIFSDGSEKEIEETSPFWMDIRLVSHESRSARIPLTDGFIQVSLPQDFYQKNPDQLAISWIDFFR